MYMTKVDIFQGKYDYVVLRKPQKDLNAFCRSFSVFFVVVRVSICRNYFDSYHFVLLLLSCKT